MAVQMQGRGAAGLSQLTAHFRLTDLFACQKPRCCALILLDLLTGLAKAKIQGKLNSDTGYKGFWRKAALLAALAFGICLDLLVEYAAAAGLGAEFPALIGRLLAVYIAVNECISITENLSACGVQLPGFLAAALGSARDKLDQR